MHASIFELFNILKMSTSPKITLITGCSSGLGYSLALASLKAGHKVIATSRNPDKTPDKVAQITSLGGQWAALDVASPSLEAQFKENILPLFPDGKIDVLINNAGIGDGSVVEDIDLEAARTVFETNFWGILRLTKLVVPIMRVQGSGHIVNISSTSSMVPLPMLSVYSASKAAVDILTVTLAAEVAPFGIRAFTVNPAGISTPFIENSAKGNTGDLLKAEYKGTTADFVLPMLFDPKNFSIDPDKAAELIVAAVDVTGPFKEKGTEFLKLPLGSGGVDALLTTMAGLKGTAEAFSEVAKSV